MQIKVVNTIEEIDQIMVFYREIFVPLAEKKIRRVYEKQIPACNTQMVYYKEV